MRKEFVGRIDLRLEYLKILKHMRRKALKLFIPAVPKLPHKSNISISNSKRTDLDTYRAVLSSLATSESSTNSSVLTAGSHNNIKNKISPCTSCIKNDALLKKMFSMHSIESDLNIAFIRMLQINNNVVQEDSEYIKKLPANDIDELKSFNKALEREDIFAAVANSLQTVGGRDTIDGCRRLMCKIMTNQLALTFNWLGRNNKKGFCDLQNIIKLIIAVLRKNSLCRNSTQAEVEAIIKKWLRNACDRDSGRSRRDKREQGKE